jgi:iron complex outermembrane recepter protein
VGQGLRETDAFTVLPLTGGWKIDERWQLTAGVDTLPDETCAGHLSGGGAKLAGSTHTARVNEARRLAWLRIACEL